MGNERLEDNLVVPHDKRVRADWEAMPFRLALPHDEYVVAFHRAPGRLKLRQAWRDDVREQVDKQVANFGESVGRTAGTHDHAVFGVVGEDSIDVSRANRRAVSRHDV